MERHTCFFIGHRDVPDALYAPLAAAVERHIVEYGVRTFVVGHYGRFDALTARAVRDAKTRHAGVTLLLLLPYHPSERSFELLDGFDGTVYPDGMELVPRRAAIVQAKRRMVAQSDFLIAYALQAGSNAGKLAAYARAREKRGQIRVTMLR